jgi:hypothetical protein
MRIVIAIITSLAFLSVGCPKEVKKEEKKVEEPKNGEEEEGPAWSKFPMPKDDE